MRQFGDIPSNGILNIGGGDFAEGFAQGFVCHDPIQNRFIVKNLGIFTITGDITKLLHGMVPWAWDHAMKRFGDIQPSNYIYGPYPTPCPKGMKDCKFCGIRITRKSIRKHERSKKCLQTAGSTNNREKF